MTLRLRNPVYLVDIQAMMLTGHTTGFQRLGNSLPGDCPYFYVYQVDILAMLLTEYTILDVDLGVGILLFSGVPG